MPRPPADDPSDPPTDDRHIPERDSERSPHPTRRRVLAGLAALGSLAGCGGRDGATDTPTDGTTTGRTTDGTATFGPSPEPTGPWPQARADAGNTGYITAAGPTGDPSLRWTVTAAGTVAALVGRHAEGARSDAVYAASEDGRVVSYTPSGGERWTAATPSFRFPPAVGAEHVVVPTRGSLAVLDADTGAVQRSIDGPEGPLLSPTLDGDRALVGTFAGGVVAIDLASGSRLWDAGAPSRAYPPVVADGTAYATARRWETDGGGDRPGVLVAIDVNTGELRWEVALDGDPTAPPAVRDGVVYAGTNRGRVHAVDATDGDRRWRKTVGDWVTRGPTAAVDGIYVVVLGEGPAKLAPDGTVAWRSDAGGATDPVLTDDLAVVGTDTGVVAVDRADGRTRWRVESDGAVRFDVHVADGRVYAGDDRGSLLAVDAGAGDPVWRRPLRPARMPGPVVGPKTVAGGSRDGGTYSLLAIDGTEFPLAGGAATTGLTPAVLDGRDRPADDTAATGTADGDLVFGDATRTAGGSTGGGRPRETLLGGGVDGALFRVRTADYGEPPGDGLRPTPTATPHIDLPQAAPAWTTTLDTEIRSPVTYADGVAYLGTAEGIAAVHPGDGSRRWAAELGESVAGAPAVADGAVFAVTEAGRLVGIAADRDGGEPGRVDWEATLDAGSSAGPAVADSTVFVADDRGVVRAFGVGGEQRWSRELTAPVTGGTAVTDAHAIVGTEAAEVVALNRAEGSTAWRAATRGPVRGTPAVAGGSDPTVYAADHDGTLSGVAADDGAVRFRRPVGQWLDAPPAVGHGAVFVADQTGRVYAVVGA